MGANDFSAGNNNYYNVVYGCLSIKSSSKLNRDFETTKDILKAKSAKIEQLDLRKCYIVEGDKFIIYFKSIEGFIKEITFKDNEHGKYINVVLLDKDLEKSFVQMEKYSKYGINFMNRMLNVQSLESPIVLSPYSMPAVHETGTIYYNSGVNIIIDGKKTPSKFKADELPQKVKMEIQGKVKYDNTKIVDFLFDKFNTHLETLFTKKNISNLEKNQIDDEFDDDLPF